MPEAIDYQRRRFFGLAALSVAAVDLGFMFFALQGLHNAAQEGGSYGSRWLVSDASGKRGLDASTIRDRVRLESGTRGGASPRARNVSHPVHATPIEQSQRRHKKRTASQGTVRTLVKKEHR